MGHGHRRSQGGAEGTIAPPKMPKKYIFNKKIAPNFYFSAQKPAREAYTAAIHGVRSTPHKKSAPSKTNFWLRLWSWIKWVTIFGWVTSRGSWVTASDPLTHDE